MTVTLGKMTVTLGKVKLCVCDSLLLTNKESSADFITQRFAMLIITGHGQISTQVIQFFYWGFSWKYALFQEWCCGYGLRALVPLPSWNNSPCQDVRNWLCNCVHAKMFNLGFVFTLVKSSSDGWLETLMGDCPLPPSDTMYWVLNSHCLLICWYNLPQ